MSRENAVHDASCNLLTLFSLLPCTLDGFLEFLRAPVALPLHHLWLMGHYFTEKSYHYFCFVQWYLLQFLPPLFPSSSKLFLCKDVSHSRMANSLQFSIIHRSHQACTLVFALWSPLQMLSSISFRRDAGGTWLHCLPFPA